MKTFQLTFALILCLAATQQASANFVVNNFKSWLTGKIQSLKKDVIIGDPLIKGTTQTEQALSENQAGQMRNVLEAIEKIVPSICIEEASRKFSQIHETVSSSVFQCANLTDVVKNVQDAISQSLFLGADLFQMIRTALLNVNKCLPISNEDSFKCLSDYLWGLYDQLTVMVKECKAYGQNMTNLNSQILAEINACLHPSNKTMVHQIQHVMADLKTCILTS